MNKKRIALILVLLSMAYGLTLALLGSSGSSAVGTVALVGGVVVGALWVVVGIMPDRNADRDADRTPDHTG